VNALAAPATLDTPHLRLRHPTLADAEAMLAYAGDPEVTRYMDWPTQESVASVEEFLRGCLARLADGSELTWAITVPPSDRPIGTISCRMHGAEVDFGYVLHRAFWGRGLATEAARAVVGWLATLDHVARIRATCDAANVASARVLEKSGLVREAAQECATVRPNLGPEPRPTLTFARRRTELPGAKGH
jgi:RimJ/RimL family protein N-acetyltransferase